MATCHFRPCCRFVQHPRVYAGPVTGEVIRHWVICVAPISIYTMPSPVGHALGGIALGWATADRRNLHAALTLAAVAIAPDLDLLVGDHRGISHSAGAALIAGALTYALSRRPRWALAVALAWGSHVLFDWLSNDTRPPIGVMGLWPLTQDYFKSAIEIFPPVSRRWRDQRFWSHNLWALFVELLILVPLLLSVVWLLRMRRRH